MGRRIHPHYITGTLAKYEIPTDKGLLVHSVTTSTRGPGYTVGTFLAGFIDPRSIKTFPGTDDGREAALAEAKRRAQGDEPDEPALTTAAVTIMDVIRDPASEQNRATLESLGAAWEREFRTGDPQTADRLAAVLAALTMRSRS